MIWDARTDTGSKDGKRKGIDIGALSRMAIVKPGIESCKAVKAMDLDIGYMTRATKVGRKVMFLLRLGVGC
jgi:hypothetical protein